MKHVQTRPQTRKQKGFTLIEIIVALVLLGVIIGILGVNLSESQDDVRIGTSGLWMEKQFVESVGKYRVGAGSCAGITKAALTSRGLDGNTQWGDAWTIGLVGTALTLTYPLTSSPDKATIGGQLATRMTAVSGVTGANYVDPNVVVVFTCS